MYKHQNGHAGRAGEGSKLTARLPWIFFHYPDMPVSGTVCWEGQQSIVLHVMFKSAGIPTTISCCWFGISSPRLRSCVEQRRLSVQSVTLRVPLHKEIAFSKSLQVSLVSVAQSYLSNTSNLEMLDLCLLPSLNKQNLNEDKDKCLLLKWKKSIKKKKKGLTWYK